MSIGTINGQTPPLDKYLKLEGGTMTGPLVLSGNPNSNLEAASKQYVDSKLGKYTKKWEKLGVTQNLRFSQTQVNKEEYVSTTFTVTDIKNYDELLLTFSYSGNVRTQGQSGYTTNIYFQSLTSTPISISLKNNDSYGLSGYSTQVICNEKTITKVGNNSEIVVFGCSIPNAGAELKFINGVVTIRTSFSCKNYSLLSNTTYADIFLYGR